ncbi:sensor histidine kinase YesM [Desulfofundulus luciae]|uniref:Sensor histidine kinase YesM n=1 Tax=Desulfofundulus luciae TaxID=74702 RepID=A0ABU0B694_9FIRM|nr:sensor histidine kinase YesM [Desulfofundulus luciae]
MVTVTVPIIVEDRCFGALMSGEIVEEPAEEIKREVLKRTADLPLDQERLINYFQELPLWEPREVEILAKTLYAISNCFIELGMTLARKEKVELVKALREAEFRALQAQINPHFLFNTLNTIEMLAMIEGARHTAQIVHSLAQILRHNLFSRTELTTVASELESISHYLLIQQCRLGERLRVFQNIPPDLLEMQIPALTLQPLVENAVVHGLEPLEGPGILEITGEAANDYIVFIIRDNGVGIAEPKLKDLRSRIMELKSNTDTLGLVNIQKRCRLLYGPGYGVTIISVLGKGTEVRLKLPKTTNTGGVAGEAAYC